VNCGAMTIFSWPSTFIPSTLRSAFCSPLPPPALTLLPFLTSCSHYNHFCPLIDLPLSLWFWLCLANGLRRSFFRRPPFARSLFVPGGELAKQNLRRACTKSRWCCSSNLCVCVHHTKFTCSIQKLPVCFKWSHLSTLICATHYLCCTATCYPHIITFHPSTYVCRPAHNSDAKLAFCFLSFWHFSISPPSNIAYPSIPLTNARCIGFISSIPSLLVLITLPCARLPVLLSLYSGGPNSPFKRHGRLNAGEQHAL